MFLFFESMIYYFRYLEIDVYIIRDFNYISREYSRCVKVTDNICEIFLLYSLIR